MSHLDSHEIKKNRLLIGWQIQRMKMFGFSIRTEEVLCTKVTSLYQTKQRLGFRLWVVEELVVGHNHLFPLHRS